MQYTLSIQRMTQRNPLFVAIVDERFRLIGLSEIGTQTQNLFVKRTEYLARKHLLSDPLLHSQAKLLVLLQALLENMFNVF